MNERQLDIIHAMVTELRTELGREIFTMDIEKNIERRLRLAWGGVTVYVKKNKYGDTDAKAAAIRAEYNMSNRRALMEKHDVSRAQFYKIIRTG